MYHYDLYADNSVAGPSSATNYYSYTHTTFPFQVSSARDEPYIPSTSTHHSSPEAAPLPPVAAIPSSPTPARQPHRPPRQVTAGLFEDGRISDRHSYVQAYLERLAVQYADAVEGRCASSSTTPPQRDILGREEIGRVEDVDKVIGAELNTLQKEVIFTVAALSIMFRPPHAAHFALWGECVWARTSATVQRVSLTSAEAMRTDNHWVSGDRHVISVTQGGWYPDLTKRDGRAKRQTRPSARQTNPPATRARTAATTAAATAKSKAIDRASSARTTPRTRTAMAPVPDADKVKTRAARAREAAATPAVVVVLPSEVAVVEETETRAAKMERMGTPALPVGAVEDPDAVGVDGDIKTGADQVPLSSMAPPPRPRRKARAPRKTATKRAATGKGAAAATAATTEASIVPAATPAPSGSPAAEDGLQPSRSATAVSEGAQSDKTVVPEAAEGAAVKVAGRKRKASEVVEQEQPGPEEKRPRRASARNSSKTAKGAALAEEMAQTEAAKAKRRRR